MPWTSSVYPRAAPSPHAWGYITAVGADHSELLPGGLGFATGSRFAGISYKEWLMDSKKMFVQGLGNWVVTALAAVGVSINRGGPEMYDPCYEDSQKRQRIFGNPYVEIQAGRLPLSSAQNASPEQTTSKILDAGRAKKTEE